jgi:hypothetical protein
VGDSEELTNDDSLDENELSEKLETSRPTQELSTIALKKTNENLKKYCFINPPLMIYSLIMLTE